MFVFRPSGVLLGGKSGWLPRVFRLSDRSGGRKGPCFQARPGQPTAAFLPFSQALGLFFVPLAWAPSTCSQRLPRCPVLCARPSVSAGTGHNQPTFRDCLTDSPIFLVPYHTHRTLPCPPQSVVDFCRPSPTASFSLPTLTVICSRTHPRLRYQSPHPATSPASCELNLQSVQPAHPAYLFTCIV